MGIIHVLKRRKKHFRLNTEVAAKKKNDTVGEAESISKFATFLQNEWAHCIILSERKMLFPLEPEVPHNFDHLKWSFPVVLKK